MVVKIRVTFWVLRRVRHLVFIGDPKSTIILRTTHLGSLARCDYLSSLRGFDHAYRFISPWAALGFVCDTCDALLGSLSWSCRSASNIAVNSCVPATFEPSSLYVLVEHVLSSSMDVLMQNSS